MKRALVLGAGLAGLTAALRLSQSGVVVTVLEARMRVGGRALSVAQGAGAIDLGPAWIWPALQPRIMSLLAEMDLETLQQFEDGTFIHEMSAQTARGHFPRRYQDAARVRGGMSALARSLAGALPEGAIKFGQVVSHLDVTHGAQVTTVDGTSWTGDIIVCAVPGPIVAAWDVAPAWPSDIAAALTRWPTWMAAHAKVVALYDRPFWREKGLSGGAVSQIGPMVEIADQSDPQSGVFGLFGFVGVPVERRHDPDAIKEQAVAQLVRLFGAEAGRPTGLHLQDWAREPFTATLSDHSPAPGHPPYGAPGLSRTVADRLVFAGAEVSSRHGGLIEGAILTAERAAHWAAATLARDTGH